MQIVIDIPEETYKATCNGCMLPPDVENVVQGIKNGTPLPKGHRGIVDLKSVQWAFDDAIVEDAIRTGQAKATHNEIANILETVPVIIEADAESEI